MDPTDELFISDAIIVDTARVSSSSKVINWFQDEESTGPGQRDLMALTEEELVRELFDNANIRELVFRQVGLGSGTRVFFEVRRPVVEEPSQKPGDIDVLLVPRDKPELSVALQVKPVRARATSSSSEDELMRFNKLEKLASQTVATIRMGFHRVFAMVVLSVDGSDRTDESQLFRMARSSTMRILRERIYNARKSVDDAGVVFVQVLQPTKRSFESRTTVMVGVDKSAQSREAPSRLTERIVELVRMNDSTSE